MTTENPYSAPTSPIMDRIPEIPDDILKKIKQAWVAALFSAGITLIVTLIAMSGTEVLGFSAWELIDVALVLGLAFGIYKKSRTCAVLMLIYFIISKIIIMAETGKPTGIPMALVFGYFFWQGVSGTFAYHKLKARKPALAVSNG
jgi:serine/threonine-protein kinase